MCLNPFLMRNPNKGRLHDNPYNIFKDCTSTFIKIPCGHCPECIAVKQMGLVQRVQMESLKHHVFMSTLTYNSESLPSVVVNDHEIRYADIKDLQNMFKRIRKNNLFSRPFRYFAVSELGTKKGRPHFHILWLVPKYVGDTYNTCLSLEKELYILVFKEWRRNYGSTRNPDYRPLFTYREQYVNGILKRNYDTHYINPALTTNGTSDVTWYVLKYMLKPSDRAQKLQQALKLNIVSCPDIKPGTPEYFALSDIDRSILDYSIREYEKIWNLVRPRYIKSLDFGQKKDPEIQKRLNKGIQKGIGKFDYPVYFNPDTGQTFPLSRFYRNEPRIFGLHEAYDIYYNSDSPNLDTSPVYDDKSYTKVEMALSNFERIKKMVDDSTDNILY